MLNKPLIAIPHSFKTRSRHDLVEALRAISNDSQVCDIAGVSQRDIAEHVGISESTWKRVRGVGGEWTKVDIYYLMKFISLYSKGTGVAIVPPQNALPGRMSVLGDQSVSRSHNLFASVHSWTT